MKLVYFVWKLSIDLFKTLTNSYIEFDHFLIKLRVVTGKCIDYFYKWCCAPKEIDAFEYFYLFIYYCKFIQLWATVVAVFLKEKFIRIYDFLLN